MPTSGASSANVNTTASAWSRLVQLTRTASNTPKSDTAKLLERSESLPVAKTAVTPPTRPANTPRLTESPSRPTPVKSLPTSSAQNASAMSPQDREATGSPIRADADCIDVCPCWEGQPPLPDGKCSLTWHNKRSVAVSTPKHTDLRSFWAPRASESKTMKADGSAGSNAVSMRMRLEKQRQNITADTDTSTSALPHVSLTDGEQSTQIEAAQPTPGKTESNKSQFRRAATQQLRGSLCASPTTTKGLSSPTVPVKTDPQTLPVASTQWLKHTSFSAHSVVDFEPESEGHVDEAVLPGMAMEDHDEDRDLADTQILLGLRAERSGEATSTLRTSRITESALEESSQDRPNRAAQTGLTSGDSRPNKTTQLAMPTSSQEEQEPVADDNDEHDLAPTRKTKRRLTLHAGDGLDGQRIHKKQRRKAPPVKKKQAVQTTLSLAIGGSAGMRECKVCDTVYNPFHPEDIKVHAKRHAGVLKKRTASA